MNPGEKQYNALMKIHSLVFNMAQERKISSAELEDYNQAAAKAFEALDEFKFLLDKANEEKKAAFQARNKALVIEKKQKIIIEMLGLSAWGINRLLSYPLMFLTNINKSLQRFGIPLSGENYFRMIEQKYRWVEKMIDRDKRNINTAKIQKKLYANGSNELQILSKSIMEQIASESQHIIEGLRTEKSFEELKKQIEQYWYDQISEHNFAE